MITYQYGTHFMTLDEYTCKDGDVRLQAGTDPTNGRVEICKYRTWGAICTNQWDDADARVVCRQRGYDPQSIRQYIIYCLPSVLLQSRRKNSEGIWKG